MSGYGPLRQLVHKIAVETKPTPYAGNGLFATELFPLSTVIIDVLRPLVQALDTPRLKDTCYHCLLFLGKGGENQSYEADQKKTLRACTGCGTVKYCDKTCQQRSWADCHKYECNIFAKLQPNILPNNVRAIVRLLLLHKNCRLPQGEWDELMALEAHVNKFREAGGETWQNLCLMVKAAKEYSGTNLDEHTILGLFGRLMVNCFTLVTPTFDPLGLVLHPFPALMNHSCDCNAIVRPGSSTWWGGHGFPSMQVIPLRPIKRGEEIVISYVDASLPFADRQRQLRERYFFDCKCTRCLLGPNSTSTSFLGEPQGLEELEEIEARGVQLLESAKADTSMTGPVQKLRYAMFLLRETQVWPLQRHPYPSLRHQFILTCLDAHQFNFAFAHAAIQRFKTDPELMPEKHHPIRMVHDWVFVRLIDHIMDSEKNDWAAQKFDLISYKIDIHFWRLYIIDELYRTVSDLPRCDFNWMVHKGYQRINMRTHLYSSSHNPELKDKSKYKKEIELMEKMMDDVSELDGAWKAAS